MATKPAATKPTASKASPSAPGRKPASKRKQAAPKAKPDLEVDPDVLEFIAAIDAYKLAHSRPFPSWSEILHIIKTIGYRR